MLWSFLSSSACFSFLDGTFTFHHPHNPIMVLFKTKQSDNKIQLNYSPSSQHWIDKEAKKQTFDFFFVT